MSKKTNQLVIMDYTTSLIHVYKVDPNVYVNAKFIRSIGYDPDKVVYMWGDVETREHPGVLSEM